MHKVNNTLSYIMKTINVGNVIKTSQLSYG